jgi:hypothetical protein
MDEMKITILDDGTIRVETDSISQANHMTAEAFLRNVATAAGGTQERKHKQGVIGAAIHSIQHLLGNRHSH